MRKEEKQAFNYFLFLVMGIALVVVFINAKFLLDVYPIFEPEPNSEQDIINHCSNLNLEKTANCLRDQVSTFYIFKVTPDSKILSFNELKEKGGDCRDWSFLYQKLSRSLGFNSNTYSFKINNSLSHRFAIVFDDKGDYCLFEQDSLPVCYIQ